MKLNPFEIAKMISSTMRNKELIKQRAEELKKNPIIGQSGKAKATFDIETNRISKIEFPNIDKGILEQIRLAVNDAHDKADNAWGDIK